MRVSASWEWSKNSSLGDKDFQVPAGPVPAAFQVSAILHTRFFIPRALSFVLKYLP